MVWRLCVLRYSLASAKWPQPITAWTLLLSTRTGQPLLLADSARLTTERTAATTAPRGTCSPGPTRTASP